MLNLKSKLKYAALGFAILGLACQREPEKQGVLTTSPAQVAEQPNQTGQQGGKYSFGLESCDKFLEKYEQCIMTKTFDSERESHRKEFEKSVQLIAQTAQTKSETSLAELCQKTESEAKERLKAYSCPW